MNITSILITIVGIIFIIALYLMSRITQSKLPKIHTTLLPDIKDENGDAFTSVLDDIPARDGSTPNPQPTARNTTQVTSQADNGSITESPSSNAETGSNTSKTDKNSIPQQQIVLFISAEDESGLDGNLVKQALINNGLSFGDKDIYHYLIPSTSGKNTQSSLFRIANGVEPWTLTDQDLVNKKLAGLSFVLLIPTKINDNEAVNMLINTAEKIAIEVKGVLKNQQQQVLSPKDKEFLVSQNFTK